MKVLEAKFVKQFINLCFEGYQKGWHEIMMEPISEFPRLLTNLELIKRISNNEKKKFN